MELTKLIRNTRFKSPIQAIASGEYDIVNPIASRKNKCSEKMFEIIAVLESVLMEKKVFKHDLVPPQKIQDLIDYVNEHDLVCKM